MLEEAGVEYDHRAELGGRREDPESGNNTALPAGFRAVAGYLNTPEGQGALHRLEERINGTPPGDSTALLCAEKDPGRCHRRVIADPLSARGHRVLHLIEEDEARVHERDAHARINEGRVTYPGLL